MHTNHFTPVQQLFIAAFVVFGSYLLFKRLPILPEQLWGYSSEKLLKAFLGIAFSVSGFVIYLRSKGKAS